MPRPAYTLEDGEALHVSHPTTFWIPGEAERKSLKTGQIAKLIFKGNTHCCERMWVIVTEVKSDGSYVGQLDNHPTCIRAKAGDAVRFEPRHVINIHYDGE